ncbi:MAG TPA: PEP-CTERM sorting domain-containing protein, partial [Lacipirellulaceae bacterium]|nr:PEP-CTERM sorting domain-containing protein [Lacipirellulaceae bacterium]
DSTGGWWWTGGFEIGSGSGGPPLRSLSEWATAFAVSDPVDFATAHVVGLGIGVGTTNPSENDYVDAVSYQIGIGGQTTYNFQSVPEPTSIALLGFVAAGIGLVRVRRRR